MFSNEEITLISPDKSHGRQKIIENLNGMLPHLEDEDMKVLVASTVQKLEEITDEQFQKLDFTRAIEFE